MCLFPKGVRNDIFLPYIHHRWDCKLYFLVWIQSISGNPILTDWHFVCFLVEFCNKKSKTFFLNVDIFVICSIWVLLKFPGSTYLGFSLHGLWCNLQPTGISWHTGIKWSDTILTWQCPLRRMVFYWVFSSFPAPVREESCSPWILW